MGEVGIKTESGSKGEVRDGLAEKKKKEVKQKEVSQLGIEAKKSLDVKVEESRKKIDRAVWLYKGAGEEGESFDSEGDLLDQLGFYRQSKERVKKRAKKVNEEIEEKRRKVEEMQKQLAEKEVEIEESWWFVKKNKLREDRDRISTKLRKEKWDRDKAVEEIEEAEKVGLVAESASKELFRDVVEESVEEVVDEYEEFPEKLLNQEGLIEKWSEELIEIEVRPEVERAVAKGEVRPEQAEEFISLVKESTKKPDRRGKTKEY